MTLVPGILFKLPIKQKHSQNLQWDSYNCSIAFCLVTYEYFQFLKFDEFIVQTTMPITEVSNTSNQSTIQSHDWNHDCAVQWCNLFNLDSAKHGWSYLCIIAYFIDESFQNARLNNLTLTQPQTSKPNSNRALLRNKRRHLVGSAR